MNPRRGKEVLQGERTDIRRGDGNISGKHEIT